MPNFRVRFEMNSKLEQSRVEYIIHLCVFGRFLAAVLDFDLILIDICTVYIADADALLQGT